MKIEAGNVDPGLRDVAGKGRTERSDRDAARAADPTGREDGRPDVALSARLRQIRQLAGEIRDVASVDRARVADLRARIEAGAFTPSPEAIAEAMFGELTAEEA